MAKVHRKMIVVMLAILLGVSSVANAAAGVLSCLPKSCCCTAAAPQLPHHQNMMEMPMSQGCSPKAPAPCCQVEPYQPATEVALSSPPINAHHRMILLGAVADDTDYAPEQPHLNFKPFRDDGRSKIPWIPIWLENQSILC